MQKQDNKSTLTGIILIGIIVVLYSTFFSPEETQESNGNCTVNTEGHACAEDVEHDCIKHDCTSKCDD